MPGITKKRKAVWEEMMKQSIFDATVKVIKKYGPSGIRMDRVAEEADMATGTLYNYFKDKDALLLHVIDTLFKPFHSKMLSVQNSKADPRDKIRNYFKEIFRNFNEQKDIVSILIKARDLGLKPDTDRNPRADFKNMATGIIFNILEEGISKGVFRKCHTLETATLIFGATDAFMESKVLGLVPESTVQEEVEICSSLVLPGLLA